MLLEGLKIFYFGYIYLGMAESNAALNRSLHLQRDTQFASAAIYQQLYSRTDPENGAISVPATFQVGSSINLIRYI